MDDWIELDEEWAYWINPKTMRMPRVKERVPPGVLVLIKGREDVDGRSIVVTNYAQSTEESIEDLDGKKEASAILAEQIHAFMKEHGSFPPEVNKKKTFKNGNVDLSYAPGDYDSFTVRFTPTLVGGDPEKFLDGLSPFVPEPESDEEVDLSTWKVEPAKSGRATCRTCGEKIAKGELRLGEPNEFEGKTTWKWHHFKCAASKVVDPEQLDGFHDLTAEQQDELMEATEPPI